ncbi:MAG: histidine phosphatase family protein [bacterium]|nr:histidine phosphatase family protein [bacterium]
MGWPRQLIFVRHAESVGNALQVCGNSGLIEPTHVYGLTELGREQARLTGKFLSSQYRPTIFYTSYYERSKETMRFMFRDALSIEDSRLAEVSRGIYNYFSLNQIKEKYPEELKRKDFEGLYHYRPPGGENWPDIELRIHSFIETLKNEHEEENVVISGHNLWLVLFQKIIQHYSISEAMERFNNSGFENASITLYESPTHKRLALRYENLIPYRGTLLDVKV